MWRSSSEFKDLAQAPHPVSEENQRLCSGLPDSKALDISIVEHWLDLSVEKQSYLIKKTETKTKEEGRVCA